MTKPVLAAFVATSVAVILATGWLYDTQFSPRVPRYDVRESLRGIDAGDVKYLIWEFRQDYRGFKETDPERIALTLQEFRESTRDRRMDPVQTLGIPEPSDSLVIVFKDGRKPMGLRLCLSADNPEPGLKVYFGETVSRRGILVSDYRIPLQDISPTLY